MTTDIRYPTALRLATKEGLLARVRPLLDRRQQECRMVYFSAGAVTWVQTTLSKAQSDGFVEGAVSPKEQLMLIVKDFCSGDAMTPPFPHTMRPEQDGIWRFRTPDLRLVGWFPDKGAYIVSEMELKSLCTPQRDEQLFQEAKRLRSELCADNPDFQGEKLNDCI